MDYMILAAFILIACHLLFNRHRVSDAAGTDPVSMLKAVGRLLYNKGALILFGSIAGQSLPSPERPVLLRGGLQNFSSQPLRRRHSAIDLAISLTAQAAPCARPCSAAESTRFST